MTRPPPRSTLFPYTTLFRSPTNLTNRNQFGKRLAFKAKRPWETFVKEFLHGHNGLEGTSHLRFNFDPRTDDHGGAGRAHQLQPTAQGMSLASEAAPVLPALQPHGGALRNCEGLRIRERSVRALQRRGTRQDRAGLGARRGDYGVREDRRSRSAVLRCVPLSCAG